VIVAIDAANGNTAWEYKYPASTAGLDFEYGAGPHATPLLLGNRLFAVSSAKQLFALDKHSGKLLWSHDLVQEYNAPKAGRGYSCSPLAYENTVILPVGGPGQAVMAFNPQTGAVVWKNQSFDVAPASPIVITVDGHDQLIVFGANEVAALDPKSGALLWTHPHKTDWGLNISTPVWGPDNLLFISSAYNGGSRVLQLSQASGQTKVKELWFSNKMRIHFGTVIRLGDYAYGSSGDFGPAFLTAIDVKTGKIAWQDRSFSRASFLAADGKLILLDEDGTLGLVTVSPKGIQVLARADILSGKAWTVPTLVGTKLYVRDRKSLMALDLG
jgi:outer membrane protein assembly factor BamB